MRHMLPRHTNKTRISLCPSAQISLFSDLDYTVKNSPTQPNGINHFPLYLGGGDSVIYHHTEGDRPAIYKGRHGRYHILEIPAHGARGRGLRYVEDGDFHSIPSGEHQT